MRTVVQIIPDAERSMTERRLDSVALFGGTVYWITGDADHGTVESHALDTGAVAEVAAGQRMWDLRTTPIHVA